MMSVLARRSEAEDLKALSDLVERHEVGLIVIGLPRLMNGRIDAAAQQAQAFGANVAKATGRPWSCNNDVAVAAYAATVSRRSTTTTSAAVSRASCMRSGSSCSGSSGPTVLS